MSKGLILVFTGDGKGKTTAAFGTALRILGRGGRVGVVQFFKRSMLNAQRSTLKLEANSLRVVRCALRPDSGTGEVEALKKISSQFKVWSFGGGFTWRVAREVNAIAVQKAWKKCCELMKDAKYNLVILDEIHIALKYKFLKASEVIKVLKRKSAAQHVILTGRGAPRSIVKLADLVTEMRCVKHPFRTERPIKTNKKFSAALASDQKNNESQCRCSVPAQPGIEF